MYPCAASFDTDIEVVRATKLDSAEDSQLVFHTE